MFEGIRAVITGMLTTLKHVGRPTVTLNYPDEKRPIPARFRGRHHLYKHDDGLERCIGCELCAAACPSSAILVIPAENNPERPISPGERYARTYEINMLRCIFCGYCEEACPVDAIKLGSEYELSDFTRGELIYDKEMLLEPEKYAPRIQFHPDVDRRKVIAVAPQDDLGTVYRTHHPIGAPDPRGEHQAGHE